MDLQTIGLDAVKWISVARGSKPSGFNRDAEFWNSWGSEIRLTDFFKYPVPHRKHAACKFQIQIALKCANHIDTTHETVGTACSSLTLQQDDT